jgi:hydroxymethylglutaryl-CoA reductase
MKSFYSLTRDQRIHQLIEEGFLTDKSANLLKNSSLQSIQEICDHCIENTLGCFPLPLGVCHTLKIQGKTQWLALAVEETSIIAALNRAAKWVSNEGSFTLKQHGQGGVGQLLFTNPPVNFDQLIQSHCEEWIHQANQTVTRNMHQRGGGLNSIIVRTLPMGKVIHLHIDTCESMGANLINQACEWLRHKIQNQLNITAQTAILSNLTDHALTQASIKVKCSKHLGETIATLSLFAQQDPYRACTHNKGIMNAIDGLMIATGNDWRGVEAACHAFAAKSGKYQGLSQWHYQSGFLYGELSVPMQIGVVGGVTKLHPVAKLCLTLMNIQSASQLAELTALSGLLQNLAALSALSGEGIVKGHMKLHLDNLARTATEDPNLQTKLRPLLQQQLEEHGYVHASCAHSLLLKIPDDINLP